ncbi:MAG: reverse transcriptase domain-containing protein, partial [Syntrophales bacterium]
MRELDAPQSEIDWITKMFSEGLDVLEPETLIENIHMANYPSVAANATNFREYLKTEVSQGHLLRTKVGFGPIPARVVPVAFIPKPGQPGKFRLISDASAPIGRSTNFATITPPHFYMVNPSDVFYRSDRSTWGCIADADAAFRQLPINPLHAGLLAIEFEGYYYWELRAPFGWTLAPFSWCCLTSIIQRYCAAKGHNIVVYVDDFLCLGQSKEAAQASQDFLIQLMPLLGLRDKPSKRTVPSQIVTFIGFIFDFRSLSISISPERVSEILQKVEHVLSSTRVKTSELSSLAGKLIFVSQVVLGARTFMRRLFDSIKLSSPYISLSPALTADLRWWSRFLLRFNGLKVLHWSVIRPEIYCCTDASDLAACGISPGPRAWVHTWSERQSLWHINIRELWAVYRSLLTWGSSWENHDAYFAIDNAAVVSWINSGTARSTQAMSLLRKIFWITASKNIRLSVVWISSGLNAAADAGSRLDFNRLISLTGISPDS